MSEERKLVTLLFADVTGSTALGDALDPEDVRALMGRYYAHARRIIAEYGGTLEKFIGDAVMAIFGMPQAHGDDAERAVAAALALRAAVADDPALPFALRLGVNTGEVIATSDHSDGDFLVTGDAVNVAARLQQHAAPGEILAGERTFAAARFAVQFDEPRAIEVKGKPLPLRVFPVAAMRPTRLRERPALVGRRADLMQMDLLRERVAEERLPHLITIVAPAGTGKTRILEEFLAHLDPATGFRVATARCLPYGQQLAYYPLRGMLQSLLGTATIDREALHRTFTAGGYGMAEAGALAELILTTQGSANDLSCDREQIFAAWRLLFESCAHQTPLVLIYEDIHWASDTLLDLLEHLTQRSKDAPILIMALSRPELLDRRPTWGGGRQNSALLGLQPLTAAQTSQLLAAVLPEWTEEQRDRIAARSGGNPFFALEIAHGLAERGAQAADDVLPDTVHAAVLARLDLLAPTARETLQVVSVAGRTVRAPQLKALLPSFAPAAIDDALEDLVARDLLLQPESGRFAFRHILLRDVAYGTLSRADRIRLHSALAERLEADGAVAGTIDPYTELIAYHYREAVLLARQSAIPATLPFPIQRAIACLRRAGDQAAHAGAFEEAKAHFRDALSLAGADEHLAIQEQFGDALPWGDTAFEAYQAALECWRMLESRDPAEGARLMRKLVTQHVRGYVSATKRPTPAQLAALIVEGLTLAESAGVGYEIRRLRVLEILLQGQAMLIPRDALIAKRSVALAIADECEAIHDWQGLSMALDAASLTCAYNHDFPAAQQIIQRRLAIPGLSAVERYDALTSLVAFHSIIGDFSGAIAIALEAVASLRPEDSPVYLGGSLGMALLSAYYGGLWDEIDPLRAPLEAVESVARFDPTVAINICDGYIALMQMALAREDRPNVDRSFASAARLLTDPKGYGLAMVNALRDENLDSLRQAMPDWPGMMMLEGVITLSEFGIAVGHDLIDRAQDDRFPINFGIWAQAVAHALADEDYPRLAQAIAQAEAHAMPMYVARMRLVLAERTGDPAPLALARPVLEQARDRRFLRRLDEIAARLPVPVQDERR